MLNILTRAWHALAKETGFRFLARRRAAAIVAVLTMALALGANTAVFAVVKAFLLSNFALPNADRVFNVAPRREIAGQGLVTFAEAYPNYRLLRDMQRSFIDVAVLSQSTASWADGDDTRPLQASRVSASFFATVGVHPVRGREFTAAEEGTSPAPVVVISDALWHGAMGNDPNVLGRTMLLNGVPHTIIGVMPVGFVHPLQTDIWFPFSLPANQSTAIVGARNLAVIGRLRDDVSKDQAVAEMKVFTQRTIDASEQNKNFHYELLSFREALLPGVGSTMLFVQAGALVLLLLAVLNLSSLLVAWGFDRKQEMALRLALGSGRSRVVRLTLQQGLTVVAAGGTLGVLIAALAIPAIRQLDVPPVLGLFMAQMHMDLGVLAWSVLMVVAAGIAAGMLPVMISRNEDIGDAMRATSRSASLSPAALRWQKGMVFAQAALSVVMLCAAALIGVSFRHIVELPTGLAQSERVVARVRLTDAAYPGHAPKADFAARLRDNLMREPALAHVGFTTTLPIGDLQFGGRFFVEMRDGGLSPDPLLLHLRRISPDYLSTIGIRLLKGRDFTAQDDAQHPPVAIVSRATADRLWPGEDPIGKRLYRGAPPSPTPVAGEVVGVVDNVLDAGYTAPPGEAVYLPYAQVSFTQISIIAEPRADAAAGISAIRNALRATDPQLAATGISTLETMQRQASSLPRLQMILLLTFAAVAVGIVGLGSYGVMSQLVTNRQRELALRLVFGAAPTHLASSVMAQIVWLTVPGIVLGSVAVFVLKNVLRPFVFGIEPSSASVMVLVGAGVLTLALIATIPSALRAMRTDLLRGISAA